MGSEPDRGLKSTAKRRIGQGLTTGVGSTLLLTGLASAQSATQWATDMCNTDGYNFLLGAVLVTLGIVVVAAILGATGGVGMLQVSFLSKTFAKGGKKGIVYSAGGLAILVFLLAIISLVSGSMSITPPEACTGPF